MSSYRPPGLDPGSRFSDAPMMEGERQDGWVYIMADRYRGTMYVGVTSHLATRIHHEKRLKRWRRQWKFELIERGNPDWQDMFDLLA